MASSLNITCRSMMKKLGKDHACTLDTNTIYPWFLSKDETKAGYLTPLPVHVVSQHLVSESPLIS